MMRTGKLAVYCGVALFLVLAEAPPAVHGHGMMLDPPQRSSMFKLRFPVPPNYNDNSLNCGGFSVSKALLHLFQKPC